MIMAVQQQGSLLGFSCSQNYDLYEDETTIKLADNLRLEKVIMPPFYISSVTIAFIILGLYIVGQFPSLATLQNLEESSCELLCFVSIRCLFIVYRGRVGAERLRVRRKETKNSYRSRYYCSYSDGLSENYGSTSNEVYFPRLKFFNKDYGKYFYPSTQEQILSFF